MYLMFLAVPTLPHESPQHRTLEALPRICQRNQGSVNYLQVSTNLTTNFDSSFYTSLLNLQCYNVLELLDLFKHGRG